MPEQFGEKQHEASPRRRQQAREKGQLARSQDLTSAVTLLGAIGILRLLGGQLTEAVTGVSRRQLSEEAWLSIDTVTLVALWHGLVGELARTVLPIFGLMLLVAIAANMGQVGILLLPSKLAFDFSRINPLQGLKRIFSIPNTVRLGLGRIKVIIVATVAGASLWSERAAVLQLTGLGVLPIAAYLIDTILSVSFKVGIALLILAVADYLYQRWKHEQDLKMTTQEVREELKETQGDPQMAMRRRAVQRQLAMNRLGTDVPTADVVVTNPTELAIAIRYDYDSMEAPVVVAKGSGVVAQRIRRLALASEIPVIERKELARALYKHVEVGKPIQPEQYAAMAEVLRYVYELKGKTLPELDAA